MARKQSIIRIVTLDTETYGLDGDIKRIALYDAETVIYGYDFSDIEPYLIMLSKGFSVHVYIHNVEFDLRKIRDVFNEGNVIWEQSLLINGKFAKLTCKHYTIHDSFKILPMSLEKLSKSFKLKHGKLDLWEKVQEKYGDKFVDKNDYFINCDKDDPLYIEYLGYDVLSLHELIMKLIDISGISERDFVQCITSASISKRIFRKGYKGRKFKTDGQEITDYELMTVFNKWQSTKKVKGDTPITFKETELRIRQSYYGGRVEVFKPLLEERNNEITGYHMDVNSLYPSAMIDNEFPIGFPQYYTIKNDVENRFNTWMDFHNGLGFLHVHVYVPDQHIPPLPIKKGKLCFMCGHLKGWWTYNELEYAIKECGVQIIEYFEMIHFERTFKVFHNFISVFSDIKVNAKESGEYALVEFAKLLLNTGYGYTGMRREKTGLIDIDKISNEHNLIYVNTDYGFAEYLDIIDTDSIQPQIASYVTSYARLILLDALRTANNIGEIYYCDTDSIVASRLLPDEMLHKKHLGKWDVEHKLITGIFLQPKVYTEIDESLETTIKFKGVSKDKQKTLDFKYYAYLKKLLEEKKVKEELIEENIKRFSSVRVHLKNGTDMNTMLVTEKNMKLDNKQKRIIDYKENYTKPYYNETLEDFYNFSFNDHIKLTDGALMSMVI